MTKWLTLGSIAAAGAIGTTLLRRRSFEHRPTTRFAIVGADFEDLGVLPVGEIPESVTHAGIADVDPQPLSQTGGKVTTAAHTELRDLRERLPQPGKNLT